MSLTAAPLSLAGITLTPQIIVLVLGAGAFFFGRKQGVQTGLMIAFILVGALLVTAFPQIGADLNQILAKA